MTNQSGTDSPETRPLILIVDDSEEVATALKWELCDDYRIITYSGKDITLEGAIEQFQLHNPDLTLSDTDWGGAEKEGMGLLFLDRIGSVQPSPKRILMSAHSLAEVAKAHGLDFYEKLTGTKKLRDLIDHVLAA
jgi:DNA-binding NtrC family response regulator